MSYLLEKWIAPLKRRVSNIICKAVLENLNADGNFQVCNAVLQKDETQGDLERIQEYGLVSRPEKGAEVVVLHINGDRNQGLIICIGDSRYKIDIAENEVALYSKADNKIHLKADGSIDIVTDGSAAINIGATSVKKLVNEDFKAVYNVHTHPDPVSEVTGVPVVLMTDTQLTSKVKAQ